MTWHGQKDTPDPSFRLTDIRIATSSKDLLLPAIGAFGSAHRVGSEFVVQDSNLFYNNQH